MEARWSGSLGKGRGGVEIDDDVFFFVVLVFLFFFRCGGVSVPSVASPFCFFLCGGWEQSEAPLALLKCNYSYNYIGNLLLIEGKGKSWSGLNFLVSGMGALYTKYRISITTLKISSFSCQSQPGFLRVCFLVFLVRRYPVLCTAGSYTAFVSLGGDEIAIPTAL